MPTLILGGDRDKIVPLINMKMIHRAMPNARLHVVPGGGHLFIISRLPEIMPIVRGFLEEPLASHRRWRRPRAAPA